MADLDCRLSAIAKKKKSVDEKIAVLKANAEKINPSKKVVSTKVLRYKLHVHVQCLSGTSTGHA